MTSNKETTQNHQFSSMFLQHIRNAQVNEWQDMNMTNKFLVWVKLIYWDKNTITTLSDTKIQLLKIIHHGTSLF
jgi:hypothetical protein